MSQAQGHTIYKSNSEHVPLYLGSIRIILIQNDHSAPKSCWIILIQYDRYLIVT
ncbi:hypothetical protein K456DRAFT_58975 [Colletotrichum gloeosporioides 23]|uniref:Uncharacterized protein n=1 Tax=Colletotrichum kahawae TaxID=34407 RepID=A0AAD9Y1H0_COLKA|nr:hypothetical protein K456DRAFT_59634 [Colletotrichum gloeosporioides 23]KAH9226063.1 hypothetical protein K456DRAFT_58975 [Colletotrichum gloeosporioides 23]KAK2731765.1 hypothetical protein CKAH01_19051 [Colletotrichum kahawae]